MIISFDWVGTYLEHKEYFDQMAKALQKAGHKVYILTGEREARKPEILKSLGFTPDMMILWGDYESIANSNRWKVEKMIDHDILVHYDDEASGIKQWTNRWVIKVMNSDKRDSF